MKYIRRFDTAQEKAEATLTYPNVNWVVDDDIVAIEPTGSTPPTPHNYYEDYFTLVPDTAATTFTFSKAGLSYSTDSGATWTALAANTPTPSVAAGNKILFKGSNLTPTQNEGIGTFTASDKFTVEGNIMSLHFGDNFTGATNLTGKDNAFRYLFCGCTMTTDAENLVFPSTNAPVRAYASIFHENTSLVKAPKIFEATTLSNFCYEGTFNGCTSLITAPELPATSVSYAGYSYMFTGCTSLQVAPELPATTLAGQCYIYMFDGCTSLNYIKCLATTGSNNYNNWVRGVASTGTFVKKTGVNWPSGASGIPSGWTVEAYVEPPIEEAIIADND